MFDRPSFDPRYSHGQQAGGSSIRRQSTSNGIPAMFLPNYSGDGQGRVHTSVSQPSLSQSSPSMEGDLPVWSGDGRHSVANPMMPIYQADGRASYGAGQTGHHPSENNQTSNPAGGTLPPQVLPATGDGKGSVDLSNELSMTVNSPATVEAKPARKSRSKKTRAERTGSRAERSETWKLVALVVIFLIWVSTASTLLFLYMDRYLFP